MIPDEHRPSRCTQRPEERGTVLILFALLFVGIFGLMGVVIDGGRLRATRQQMEAGAECAALEGMRFRDAEGDERRRARAIRATSLLFDDDMDPDNGDAMGLGAGTLPVVSGDAPYRGTITVDTDPGARTWKPAGGLEPNLDNRQHGDLVAGDYIPGAQPSEDDAFDRSDFVSSPAGSAAATLAAAPAFLVRLRRASDRLDLDRDAGASSAGPPFEWLWARGAIWHEPTPGQSNLSRNDGLTLRATAIAAAERALYVSNDPVLGTLVANFALRVDAGAAWESTPPFASINFEVQPDGLLTLAGSEGGAATATPARLVGAAVSPSLATWGAPPAAVLIVPVYAQVNSARQIVGFARSAATLSGATLTVTRLPGAMLPTGASNTSPAALDARVTLETNPVVNALHSSFQHPVMAPVLRR